MKSTSHISADYVSDILDEIALEGLDGITPEGLWKRLSVRPNFCLEIDDNSKNFIWNIIVQMEDVKFYEIPEARAPLMHYNCSLSTENLEASLELDKIYPYHKLKIVNGEFGSCQYYSSRIDISQEVINLTLKEVNEKWGNKIVIVASQEIRTIALIGNFCAPNIDFSKCIIHYDILERIGRCRYLGLATCGKGSVQSVVEDSKSVFHYLKFLYHHKLIKKQSLLGSTYSNANASKIHLNRFFEPCSNDNLAILRRAVEELKTRPNYAMPLDEFNALFDARRKSRLKKFKKSLVFKKFISLSINLPYRSIFPDAEQAEWERKSKSGERIIRCVQLVNPNVEISSIVEKDCEIEDDDLNSGFLPKGIFYENMPIVAQAFHHIKHSGAKGLSHTELGRKMGLAKHFIRGLINRLNTEKHCQFYVENDGRKRLKRYIVGENIQNKKAASEIVQILSESNVESGKANEIEKNNKNEGDSTNKVVLKKQPCISQLKEENISYRSLRRIGMIIKTIKAHRFRLLQQIVKFINKEEIKEGVTSRVDRHTVKRMLNKLEKDGLIKIIVLTEKDKTGHTVNLYTDPTFEPDERQLNALRQAHPSYNSIEIGNSIDKNFFDLERQFSAALLENLSEMKKMLNGVVRKLDEPNSSSVKETQLVYSPKFIRLNILHDFIFHLIYDYTGIVDKTQEEMIEELSKTTPIDEDLKKEMPKLYGTQPSTYMFVSPLNNSGKMPGWFLVSDILIRMPLSIMAKTVKVSEPCPDLWRYLHHPVRKHFLVKDLPLSVRQTFFCRKYQMGSFYQDFRRLCFIGLMQFGFKFGREQYQTLGYLNRKASLLDTSTSPPEYYQVPADMAFEVRSYYFKTKADVKKYWMDMFNICMATNLGSKTNVIGKEILAEREFGKEALKKVIEPKSVAQVLEDDNGTIPGDNLGAAGLDSVMFSFLRSNWTGPLNKSKEEVKKKKISKLPIHRIKKELILSRSSLYRAMRRKNGLNRGENISPSVQNEKPKKTKFRKVKEREVKFKRKRNILYDEVDLEALKLMNSLRVTWSTAEDNFLLICRVAMMFLCPNSRTFVRIPYVEVRKVLQENFVESRNKTQKAVARRIVYMLKNPTTFRSVNLCLEELKEMPEATTRFDCSELLSRIKPSTPNLAEFQNQLYAKFRELVLFLKDRFIDNTNFQVKKDKDLIPDTIEEFLEKFKFDIREENPVTITAIRQSVIRAILMSSLSCRADKTSSAVQLFDIYRQYNDDELYNTIKKLQADKVITLSKKAGNSIFKDGKLLPLTFTPYKLSFAFQHLLSMKYSHSIYYDSFCQINKVLDLNEEQEFEVDLNECNMALFLLASKGLVLFRPIIPDQIIILDSANVSDAAYSKMLERHCEMLRYSESNTKVVCSSGKILTKPQDEQLQESFNESNKRKIEDLDTSCPKKAKLDAASFGEEADEDEEEDKASEITEESLRESTPQTEKKLTGNEKATKSSRVILYMMREEAKKEANNDSNRLVQEFCVVNASKIMSKINKTKLQEYSMEIEPKAASNITKNIISRSLMPSTLVDENAVVSDSEKEKEILNFICSKKELGTTAAELKSNFHIAALPDVIQHLMEAKIIIKSGISETRYISQKYCSSWLLNSFKMSRLEREKIKPNEISAVALDTKPPKETLNNEIPKKKMKNVVTLNDIKSDNYIPPACSSDASNKVKLIIRPWIRIDGSLNRKVLDRFLGTILAFIMSHPGISIKSVMDKFSPSFTPVWTKDLIEILIDIGCVTPTTLKVIDRTSLFSKSTIVMSDSYSSLEDDNSVVVEAKVDAVTTLGLFIGKKTYAKDFLVD